MADSEEGLDFGGKSDTNAAGSRGGAGGVSNSGGSRNKYHDKIYVEGEYGKTLRRRDEDADVGNRKLGVIVGFSGEVEYEGEEYGGLVSVGVGETESFLEALWNEGVDFRVYNFQK